MKQSIMLLAVAASLFLLPACEKITGEGPLQTETRAVTGFTGIAASIPGTINYTIGTAFKVEITAQRNILDVIETFNENGHLVVKIRNGVKIREHEDLVVTITAPSADFLHLSGSGDLSVYGNVIAAGLDLRISGSGAITVNNAAVSGTVNATVSGSGDIKIVDGVARDLDLNISGSGKIIMDAVNAEKAVAKISGSGDIYVKLSQLLDATISGSGSIYYRGTPQITTHISGSGRIKPL